VIDHSGNLIDAGSVAALTASHPLWGHAAMSCCHPACSDEVSACDW